MSIRTTLIAAVNAVEIKTKKPAPLRLIKGYLQSKTSKIAGNLWQIAKEGHLKKAKFSGESRGNTYALTAKGRKYLKENNDIFSAEQFSTWEESGGGRVKKNENSAARYGGEARSAIESISTLINTNDKLTNSLRGIHSQLTLILEDIDGIEGDGHE